MEKIKFKIDLRCYPKNAIYATAYCFLDKVYISLEMESAKKTLAKNEIFATIVFEKDGCNKADLKEFKKEFLKELFYSTIRNGLSEKNKKIREAIVAQALFSAIGGFGEMTDCEDMRIEKAEKASKSIGSDPLGISLAWENRYEKS